MATDEEELLTALGARTIPPLPLSSELYEFTVTICYPYTASLRPPDDRPWHLVSVSGSFDRVESDIWPPGAPAAVKVVKYEPQAMAVWALRKK